MSDFVKGYSKISVGSFVNGNGLIRIITAMNSTVQTHDITRDEARLFGKTLICIADLADELDKEWEAEKEKSDGK